MTEAIFGLLGVLLGALISGVIMWTVARRDRLHSDEVARADRRQRHVAARKDQWWARARWSMDLLLQDDEQARSLGFGMLDVLTSDEWADTRELQIINAVVRSGAAMDFEWDSDDTEPSGGAT